MEDNEQSQMIDQTVITHAIVDFPTNLFGPSYALRLIYSGPLYLPSLERRTFFFA